MLYYIQIYQNTYALYEIQILKKDRHLVLLAISPLLDVVVQRKDNAIHFLKYLLFMSKSKSALLLKTIFTDHTQEFESAMVPRPAGYTKQHKDKKIKIK